MDFKKDQRITFEIGKHEAWETGPRTVLKDFNADEELRNYLRESSDDEYRGTGFVDWLESQGFITNEENIDGTYSIGDSKPGDRLHDYKDFTDAWRKEAEEAPPRYEINFLSFQKRNEERHLEEIPHQLKVNEVTAMYHDDTVYLTVGGHLNHEDESTPVQLTVQITNDEPKCVSIVTHGKLEVVAAKAELLLADIDVKYNYKKKMHRIIVQGYTSYHTPTRY